MPLPPIPAVDCSGWPAPDAEQCRFLLDKYKTPEHIRAHSITVRDVARLIGLAAQKSGLEVCLPVLEAAALLHDIGKAYSIRHGGAHSQLGASIVMEETGNPVIAQAVMHHVFWPEQISVRDYFTPLTIIYSDKRVRHNQVVSIDDRFSDLFSRYGINETRMKLIQGSKNQALEIENELEKLIGVDLHACTFDCRRLVQ
ncbi:MAG: HD domain-containing protein [Desulfonatronovibrionaceae bacterium]